MSISTFFISNRYHPTPFWILGANFFITLLGISFVCFAFFQTQVYQWEAVWEYRELFVQGWFKTIQLSFLSLIFSCMIGILCALLRKAHFHILRFFSIIYIEVIRGTPLLVQILFFYYVIANAIGLENRTSVGVIVLSLFGGAYLAEIFRAGIENIPKSQTDAAKAMGFTRFQTYRHVIFPQAFRNILPPLTGQLASLVKDSSLLSVIGVRDFSYMAQQVNSATYSTLESFFPLALGYLALTIPISLFSRWLERKYRYAY